jgi:alpha-glucosidase (family GH31 glycosyl hydrolase)
MRLLYTCLFETKWFGNTCFDPLFYYYPYDDKTFENIEESFIFGGALKVSPILQAGVSGTYSSYFPKGKWVSLIITGPGVVELQPHSTVNVHLRPGSLISF